MKDPAVPSHTEMGWFHKSGDPDGTVRWWSGVEWSRSPLDAEWATNSDRPDRGHTTEGERKAVGFVELRFWRCPQCDDPFPGDCLVCGEPLRLAPDDPQLGLSRAQQDAHQMLHSAREDVAKLLKDIDLDMKAHEEAAQNLIALTEARALEIRLEAEADAARIRADAEAEAAWLLQERTLTPEEAARLE